MMAYKECLSCGKKVHPNTKTCKYCGANPDIAKVVKEEVVKDVAISRFSSTYKSSRMMAQASSFAGWLIFAFSITGFIMAFVEKGLPSSLKIFGPLLGVVGGIIIVVAGQLTRAVADVSDHCSEILAILKMKNPK
jgi:hypothetical protein